MSESIGSEIHLPAPNGVIKEIRVDEKTGGTTISYPHCVSCGACLSLTNWSLCSQRCLLCRCCVRFHEETAYCRRHFESEVMNKRECKVLLCLMSRIKFSNVKKLAGMSKDQVDVAYAELIQRGLMVVKDFWVSKEYRPTDTGLSAMKSTIQVFGADADFAATAQKIMEAGLWPQSLR